MKPAFEFFVAGLVHGDFDVQRLRLAKGDTVRLKREPENAHDQNAIRIELDGRKLGYVPKALAGSLPRKRPEEPDNQGIDWHAAVINFAPTNPTHRMILVGIFQGPAPVKLPAEVPRRRLITS